MGVQNSHTMLSDHYQNQDSTLLKRLHLVHFQGINY